MTTYLDALAKLGEDATEGPWRQGQEGEPDGDMVIISDSPGVTESVVADLGGNGYGLGATGAGDLRFIAVSRNMWDELVSVARAAEVRHAGESGNPLSNALAALKAKVETL